MRGERRKLRLLVEIVLLLVVGVQSQDSNNTTTTATINSTTTTTNTTTTTTTTNTSTTTTTTNTSTTTTTTNTSTTTTTTNTTKTSTTTTTTTLLDLGPRPAGFCNRTETYWHLMCNVVCTALRSGCASNFQTVAPDGSTCATWPMDCSQCDFESSWSGHIGCMEYDREEQERYEMCSSSAWWSQTMSQCTGQEVRNVAAVRDSIISQISAATTSQAVLDLVVQFESYMADNLHECVQAVDCFIHYGSLEESETNVFECTLDCDNWADPRCNPGPMADPCCAYNPNQCCAAKDISITYPWEPIAIYEDRLFDRVGDSDVPKLFNKLADTLEAINSQQCEQSTEHQRIGSGAYTAADDCRNIITNRQTKDGKTNCIIDSDCYSMRCERSGTSAAKVCQFDYDRIDHIIPGCLADRLNRLNPRIYRFLMKDWGVDFSEGTNGFVQGMMANVMQMTCVGPLYDQGNSPGTPLSTEASCLGANTKRCNWDEYDMGLTSSSCLDPSQAGYSHSYTQNNFYCADETGNDWGMWNSDMTTQGACEYGECELGRRYTPSECSSLQHCTVPCLDGNGIVRSDCRMPDTMNSTCLAAARNVADTFYMAGGACHYDTSVDTCASVCDAEADPYCVDWNYLATPVRPQTACCVCRMNEELNITATEESAACQAAWTQNRMDERDCYISGTFMQSRCTAAGFCRVQEGFEFAMDPYCSEVVNWCASRENGNSGLCIAEYTVSCTDPANINDLYTEYMENLTTINAMCNNDTHHAQENDHIFSSEMGSRLQQCEALLAGASRRLSDTNNTTTTTTNTSTTTTTTNTTTTTTNTSTTTTTTNTSTTTTTTNTSTTTTTTNTSTTTTTTNTTTTTTTTNTSTTTTNQYQAYAACMNGYNQWLAVETQKNQRLRNNQLRCLDAQLLEMNLLDSEYMRLELQREGWGQGMSASCGTQSMCRAEFGYNSAECSRCFPGENKWQPTTKWESGAASTGRWVRGKWTRRSYRSVNTWQLGIKYDLLDMAIETAVMRLEQEAEAHKVMCQSSWLLDISKGFMCYYYREVGWAGSGIYPENEFNSLCQEYFDVNLDMGQPLGNKVAFQQQEARVSCSKSSNVHIVADSVPSNSDFMQVSCSKLGAAVVRENKALASNSDRRLSAVHLTASPFTFCGYDVVRQTAGGAVMAQIRSDGAGFEFNPAPAKAVQVCIAPKISIPLDKCNFCEGSPIFARRETTTVSGVTTSNILWVQGTTVTLNSGNGQYCGSISTSGTYYLAFRNSGNGCVFNTQCPTCTTGLSTTTKTTTTRTLRENETSTSTTTTNTTTTTTTTNTTTTTTEQILAEQRVTGALNLNVGGNLTAFATDPAVESSLQNSIANAVPGVEPDQVNIISITVVNARRLTVNGRRLFSKIWRRLQSSVVVDFEIIIPITASNAVTNSSAAAASQPFMPQLDVSAITQAASSIQTNLVSELSGQAFTVSQIVVANVVSEVATVTTTTVTTVTTTPLPGPKQWLSGGIGRRKMCAAGPTSCHDQVTCSGHSIGPCGGTSVPPIYIESRTLGLGLVSNVASYLTDSSQVTLMTEDTSLADNGYYLLRANQEDEYINTAENYRGMYTFAEMMYGAYYGAHGDYQQNSIYAGMGAYLLQSGKLGINKQKFLIGIPGNDNINNPYLPEVCVAPLLNGNCGNEFGFRAGDFKFSLYGFTRGTAFSLPAGVTHFGFRQAMVVVGSPSVSIRFNNRAYTLDTIGTRDVTNVQITAADGKEFTYTFPMTYNIGVTTAPETPTETKNIRIKASRSNVANEFYLDYLFERIDVINGIHKYFVYDPDVQDTTAETTQAPTQAPTPAPPTQAPTPAPPTQAPTPAPPTQAPTPAPPTQAPTPAPPTQAPTQAGTTTAGPTPAPPPSGSASDGADRMMAPRLILLSLPLAAAILRS